ncbi:hypothetical protein AMS68_003559 [Peltaster fructicola]|uniref:Uncharacterized protein n=1 Tax=Peltaster fructicola TaxID=286661 RepID=A0A6H0XTE2_9PEZI|nr:hypothetical protein AMS68_003559 [Peltaster fructicola]
MATHMLFSSTDCSYVPRVVSSRRVHDELPHGSEYFPPAPAQLRKARSDIIYSGQCSFLIERPTRDRSSQEGAENPGFLAQLVRAWC